MEVGWQAGRHTLSLSSAILAAEPATGSETGRPSPALGPPSSLTAPLTLLHPVTRHPSPWAGPQAVTR